MKRVIVLFCALLLLCGCSQEDRVQCVHCSEWVTGGISLQNGDTVCGKCFTDKEYIVCLDCKSVFDPYYSMAGELGYCDECGQKLVGFCESCENPYLREQLYDEDGTYYLCALCKNEELKENYDENYNSGYEAGKDEGYAAGFADGREEGYRNGYDAGVSTITNAAKSSSSSSSGNTSGNSASSQTQSVTVYITKTGSKYHRSGRQYLNKSKIAISLDNARAQGYTACSRCW